MRRLLLRVLIVGTVAAVPFAAGAQAPSNDDIAGAIPLACNAPGVVFDNTEATYNAAYPSITNCRKPPSTPDTSAADVWFVFNPGANTSAEISLCNTAGLGGVDPGDSLLALYRLTNTAQPPSTTNLTLVSCADDSCLLDQARLIPTTLTNQNYYIRVAAYAPSDVGPHEITIACPAPPAANDLCANATLLALVGSCAGCTPIGGGRFAVYGHTRTATVDGATPGCDGAGNSARGVWYTLVGNGNRVRLSTNDFPTAPGFDTEIVVYCGSSCGDIGCVAYNDDASNVVAQSELDFCASAGVIYWILVRGFGTASNTIGDFGLSFGEVLDTMGQPIACCDPQVCGDQCTFTIPPDAFPESGMNPSPTTEACVSNMGYTNATQFNDGCNLTPPAGQPRRWGFIDVGQTITGTLWSSGGFRDSDWFLFENLPPGTGAIPGSSLIRYSFSSEGPIRPRYYFGALSVDFSDCSPFSGFVFQDFHGCQTADNIRLVDGTATGRTGQSPGYTFAFRLFHLANGDGYPCGTNDRYWLTLHEVKSVSDCDPLLIPPGAQDEALVPTFSGMGGSTGFTFGEPCYESDPDGAPPNGGCPTPLPGCDATERMFGCGASPITDGDFLRITPGIPLAGKVRGSGLTTPVSRDIDYYKFEIVERSVVTLAIDANIPMAALLTSNDCGPDAVEYGLAGTRGRCLPTTWIEAPEIVALDAGTYIVTVFANDVFQTVGSGAIFAEIRCADRISQYVVSVDAVPLAPCSLPCPPGALVENEPCVADAALMFDSCLPDNDGCSRAPYTSVDLSPGIPACGTLFSVFEPPTGAQPEPGDQFYVDQDHWSFSLSTRSTVTFSAAADGPVRVQLLGVGAAGANCVDGAAPILAEVDAGACIAGSEASIELAPGAYALAAAPGSVAIGLSFGDYPCGQHLNYSLEYAAVPACCFGNADKIAPGAVSFGDITAVLANFGSTITTGLGPGDADCNGAVNFQDITATLANFGAICD